MTLLRQHRSRQSQDVLRAGGAIRDEGWLFTAPDGGVLRPQYLTDTWMAACKRRGISWPLHSLRHAHISQLLANGVPVKVVQRRAGHANINTTLQVYAHVLPGQDEAAASVFAQVMNGIKG
jgi:integrase